jgi:K+-transporting ATPase KdpF subunit
MSVVDAVALVIALAVLGYLLVALIRPERF